MEDLKIENQTNQHDLHQNELLASNVPLIEERLNIAIKQVETGKVFIHKKVVSEEVSQEIPVTQEEVQIDRVAINQYVETAPATRYDGNTTIISVVKEVLVVEKRLILTEELHITKKQVTSHTMVTETLRKEEIEINRVDLTKENTTNNQ